MAEQTFLTFLALMQELQRFCIEKRTGTMFIATEDNHLARIVLEDGIIISLSFHTKRGLAALDLIKAIKSGMFKFDKVKFLVGAPQKLPPSSEVLHMLLDDTLAIGLGQGGGAVSKVDLLRAMELVERELTRYIGPMAEIVCKEHFEYVHTLSEVWTTLDPISAEIGDVALELQFKHDVLKKAEMLQADFIQSAIDEEKEKAVHSSNQDSAALAEDSEEVIQVKKLVEEQLIKAIGPMGKIICKDYLDSVKNVNDITSILTKIAREIDDPVLERQFIDNVLAKIPS